MTTTQVLLVHHLHGSTDGKDSLIQLLGEPLRDEVLQSYLPEHTSGFLLQHTGLDVSCVRVQVSLPRSITLRTGLAPAKDLQTIGLFELVAKLHPHVGTSWARMSSRCSCHTPKCSGVPKYLSSRPVQ